jgi:hypothetical protein
LRALKISEIETGMEDKTRKRNEKMEKTWRQVMLYTEWKCKQIQQCLHTERIYAYH